VQALMARYNFLKTGMFFGLHYRKLFDIQGDRGLSCREYPIKLPTLVAFFQDLEAKKVRLMETLVMRKVKLITGGLERCKMIQTAVAIVLEKLLPKMITISDNTATNMIIDRLGGIENPINVFAVV
jgi:beta-lactamase class A